jgi:hypothetical protein
MSGQLAMNHAAMEARRGHDVREGEERKENLAAALGNCIQEIQCDRWAHAMYSGETRRRYLKYRAHYYTDPNAYLQFDAAADDTVLPFALGYQLVRAEAGRVLHGSVLSATWSTLRERLEKACRDDTALLQSLTGFVDRVMGLPVGPDDPHPDRFVDVCDRLYPI